MDHSADRLTQSFQIIRKDRDEYAITRKASLGGTSDGVWHTEFFSAHWTIIRINATSRLTGNIISRYNFLSYLNVGLID